MSENAKDEALLKEIRDNFEYCVRFWKDTREEGDKDMRYISGDPWDPVEKAERKGKRPCLSFDELNQYLNQLINDIRQNKRAIKLDPIGSGANEKTAEFRANLIRQIEYSSRADAVHATVFENVASRGYGYSRICKRYVSPDSFDQELYLEAIANPNTVWIDPDCKRRDRADMQYAFIVDRMRHSQFTERWPDASVTDFSAETAIEMPLWLDDKFIQVAEYWKIKYTKRILLSLDIHAGLHLFKDQLPDADFDGDTVTVSGEVEIMPGVVVPRGTHTILNQRESKEPHVFQYLTNGQEILEVSPQDGRYIAIACCFGKEKYLDEGSGTKLVVESLIRLARDPFMAYCYAQTSGMELLGMLPKALWTMYEGQAEGHEDEWQNANRSPVTFLQAKAKTEATGDTVLALPQWNHWDVPFAVIEAAAEGYKRAIQSALGMYNTSVGKHDTNAQSGVAVQKLDDQSSQGSFHLIDNFDGYLQHVGTILDDQLDYVYDTPRSAGMRTAAGDHKVVRLNEKFKDPETGEEYHYRLGEGSHSITITTGPSTSSQRDEASAFASELCQNPQVFPRIADLVVKLKNLGPIGDEISQRLVPQDIAAQKAQGAPLPPPVQALMSQQKQQLMEQAQLIQTLQAELAAKLPEIQSKQQIAAMQEETKRLAVQSQIRIAEMQAGVQTAMAKLENQVGAIQHSLEMMNAQADREHEAALAQQAQDAQAAQAAMNAPKSGISAPGQPTAGAIAAPPE
jgi:hypothetical protein